MERVRELLVRVRPPRESGLTQWVAIFIDYTKRHPKRYNDLFVMVAIASAQEPFPCPTSKRSSRQASHQSSSAEHRGLIAHVYVND